MMLFVYIAILDHFPKCKTTESRLSLQISLYLAFSDMTISIILNYML